MREDGFSPREALRTFLVEVVSRFLCSPQYTLAAGNLIGLLRGFDAAGNSGKVAAGWQGVRTVRSGLRQKFYPSPLLLSLGRQKASP